MPIYLYYRHLQLTTGLRILELPTTCNPSCLSVHCVSRSSSKITRQVECACPELGSVLPCLHYANLILRMICHFLWLILYSPNQSLPSRGAACSPLFSLLSLYWLLGPPRAPCQVIDGERQVKNRKQHAHSCRVDKMAEPIPEPSFLDPLWADLSTDSGSQFTVQFRRGMKWASWQKKRHHVWGQCSLFDRDIRTLAYREACHPCKTDLNSKNYSGWISQPQQFLAGGLHHCWPPQIGNPQRIVSRASPQWVGLKVTYQLCCFKIFPLFSLIRLSQTHKFQILPCCTVNYCGTHSFRMSSMTLILYTQSLTLTLLSWELIFWANIR